MKTIVLPVAILCSLAARSATAGVATSALRDAAEYVSERLGRATARDAAEAAASRVGREGAEAVLGRSAARAIEETGEQVARRAGVVAARSTEQAAQAVARYGSSASGLINRFGDDAAEALVGVSARNGRRLVMLENDLAESGQGASLLKLVKQKGDTVVEYLWNHKGAVATGVGVTLLLTKPEAVLSAGGSVVGSTISAIGYAIARPLAEGLVWIVTRLALSGGLAAAGVYAVWLCIPKWRAPINRFVDQAVAVLRPHRK